MSWYDRFRNLEMEEIWKFTDLSDFLIAINERLGSRSSYGENLELLSPEEQTIYICMCLEGEVNNGGFDQFLYNSSGDYAHRAEECLRAIGAHKTADICRIAFSAFGKPIPENRSQRMDFLEEMESDEICDILSDCDEQFYQYPDPLDKLCYQYIQAHKEQFS